MFCHSVVILRAHVGFDAPVFRPVTWVGDISYSLYLVHWPLFALANHMWIGDLPLPVTLGLLIASLVVAWLQYSLVEQPVHKARFGFTGQGQRWRWHYRPWSSRFL
ncbi:hypothetical protein QP162_20320 [Sphingomonas aurantiaca]|uniref:acyltransferase family protein n=1 Tax=Sphingomonas aurantiaca TaxID=185949 RepID=UPI002FE11E6F